MATSPYVYISGALTDMEEEQRATLRAFYEALGAKCHHAGFDAHIPHLVSDPVKAANLTPKQVDEIDRAAVYGSCLVIAYVGVLSFGVGIEVEMARFAQTDVWLLCEHSKRVSRLLLGNPAVTQVIRFHDFAEAVGETYLRLSRFKP